MKERFLLPLSLMIVVIIIDQLTKQWGMTETSVHFNHGFFLGFLSHYSAQIRVVALSLGAGFLFFLYVMLLYALPIRARLLRNFLSLLQGGIIGNVLDRARLGVTVDFIPFSLGDFHFVFNLADVFNWIGTLGIGWIILKREHMVWYNQNRRGSFLIWPKEQFRVAFNHVLLIFCCCLILGFFSYSYFQNMLPNSLEKKDLMQTFFITFVGVSILICLFAFVASLIMAHFTVGPVYAFKKFLDDVMNGVERPFKLRDGDSFKDLEESAQRVRDYLKNLVGR